MVLGTEERFSLQIRDMAIEPDTTMSEPEVVIEFYEADVAYMFSLYSATFVLQRASEYSAIVRLT